MKIRMPLLLGAIALAMPAVAFGAAASSPFKHVLTNDPGHCGTSPAVKVEISGIAPAKGILRVQLYRSTAEDWLQKGHWLNRIEGAVHGASATVCMPVPGPGTYGIAVRHDVNGNGETDIRTDGGGMSNNPPISILNLGKPSYKQTAFSVGNEVKAIAIRMRYL